MGRILHGGSPSALMDRVPMGIPYLRDVTPRASDSIQARRILFEPLDDALESNLGHDAQFRILGHYDRWTPK